MSETPGDVEVDPHQLPIAVPGRTTVARYFATISLVVSSAGTSALPDPGVLARRLLEAVTSGQVIVVIWKSHRLNVVPLLGRSEKRGRLRSNLTSKQRLIDFLDPSSGSWPTGRAGTPRSSYCASCCSLGTSRGLLAATSGIVTRLWPGRRRQALTDGSIGTPPRRGAQAAW
jgi:hypothetical protein